MLDLYEEFHGIVAALRAGNTPFAVCGGLAMALHSRPRATDDIDLLVPPESVEAIKAAVLPLGYEEWASPMAFAEGRVRIRRLAKLVTGEREPFVLDLLLAQGEVAEEAWRTRTPVAMEDGPVDLVSREGLIALKRLRASKLDLADIDALEGGKPHP